MHLTFYCNQTGQPQKRERKTSQGLKDQLTSMSQHPPNNVVVVVVLQLRNVSEMMTISYICSQHTYCIFLSCHIHKDVCFSFHSIYSRHFWRLWLNPVKVQFSYYIINVFIKDKMPWVFPLDKIIPICIWIQNIGKWLQRGSDEASQQQQQQFLIIPYFLCSCSRVITKRKISGKRIWK